MADLVKQYKIHILNHGIRYNKDADYLIEALATQEDIKILERNGYLVQILENMGEIGKIRQKEVGKGNRYKQQQQQYKQQDEQQQLHPNLLHPSSSPSTPLFHDFSSIDLDKSTSYLNNEEVETALSVAISAPYSAFTKLITLPEPTWEVVNATQSRLLMETTILIVSECIFSVEFMHESGVVLIY